MLLNYKQFILSFHFDEEISVNINTLSVLRSILGMNLKSMCCIVTNTDCRECLYSKTCVYSSLFESIIPKNTEIYKGRDTAPHPYLVSADDLLKNNKKDMVSISFVLFGKYIDYFPYIYGAFARGGKKGYGKKRIQFSVEVVDFEPENVQMNTWKSSESEQMKEGEIFIRLKTPLRYKSGGIFANKVETKELMNCFYRRAKTICGFYGEYSDENDCYDSDCTEFDVVESNIMWCENNRYSSRQHSEMSLGGMLGDFKLKGKFRQKDLNLIEFARLFGAGKNTNFGLGQIEVWNNLE